MARQGDQPINPMKDEIVFVRPPLVLQMVILGPLAALARALGHRPELPYAAQDGER
jgi:hypothetical protein